MNKKILLGDLKDVEIIGGQILSRIEDKENTSKEVTVLVPKAIADGTVNKDALAKIKVRDNVDENKFTKEGDIIIKLTTPYNSCIIDKESANLLIPSFCAAIRNVHNEVTSGYLLAYLNSSLCQEKIKTVVTGKVICFLKLSQIEKFEIPLVDLTKQKEIADNYLKATEKIKALKDLIKLEQEHIDSVFYEIEDK